MISRYIFLKGDLEISALALRAEYSPKNSFMANQTTILVPIRYPITDHSSRTLTAADQLAREHTPADLRVLHVNLFQISGNIQTDEITRAIAPILNGIETSVVTRGGFFVEEIILEEATRSDADIIVVGKNQKTMWRRVLSRIAGNEPAVASFLQENVNEGVDVVEIDTGTEAILADGGE